MQPGDVLARIDNDPYNILLYQELARIYLVSGDEERARQVVAKRRHMPSEDPGIYRTWGELCEELGMAKPAQECYERALRLNQDDSESLFRLALLLAETGHYEKSIHHLRKITRRYPDHSGARDLLAKNYREIGLFGQAEALAPRVKPSDTSPPERYFPPLISERDTRILMDLFSGREMGYAIQEVNSMTGEITYRYQESSLDHDMLAAHIRGETTVAAYPLRSDNTVKYSAISIRLSIRVMEANLKNKGYLALMEEKMRHHIVALSRYAERIGIPAYPEDSGNYQYRIWFFFNQFTHFLKVKRFVDSFTEIAPKLEGRFVIEPILATKPVGLGWRERCVVLPLGIQRSTSRRSFFLDDQGRPYDEQLKFLKRIRKISPKTATESLKRIRHPSLKVDSEPSSMPDTINLLMQRCPVLQEIHRKTKAGRILRREEKVILFYTIGLADYGGDTLHTLLENCPDYDYEKVQKQATRLKSHPISCVKIRELMPETTATVACNCIFDLRGGKYPSPLLHINAHLVPAAEEFLFSDDLSLREIARRYVNLRRHQVEVTTALDRLENLLDRHMSRKKIDQIKLDKIIVRKVEEEGQINWEMEQR